ncbi:MAG: metalloregulator ArsR/SmtB family transcription factor [Aquabacterium sp.]
MVQQSSQLDAVFHALADPTRRAMLGQLARQPYTISELATPYSMSLAGASKHVRVLEQAGLIRREIHGRTHVCSLAPGPLASAHEWLAFYERFWTHRLDALDRLLREEDARVATKPSVKPVKPVQPPAHAGKSSKGSKP